MKNLFFLALLPLLWAATCTQTPCPCDCPANPQDTLVVHPPTDTAKILIGINTNSWQPKDKQTAFQTLRYYLPTAWVYTESGFRGQPFLNGGKQFFGADEYLVYMHDKGVDVLLTLMQSPGWLNGQGGLTNDFPPIRPGLDKTDPKSYMEFAQIYRAFAVRYGTKTGTYPLDSAPPRWNGDGPQVLKSGLGLVKYMEIGNEVDRWWNQTQYMNAQEHAALLAACYDAIKSADPEMKVVMGGLTNYELPYLKEMQAWFTAHGRPFAADVINVHHYASLGNLPGVHPPTWLPNQAAAPELDKDFATVSQVVSWAKSIGKPVWVTEYGYDTQAGSQMSPTPFAGLTLEQIQAQWDVRATLEYLRLGVQRTYLYTIADEANPNAGTFASSGVLSGEGRGYAPKPSFDAMASLCVNLKGCTAVRDKSTPDVRIVEFDTPRGTVVYFWTPTASGKALQSVVNGKVVNVTETPQVLVGVMNWTAVE